MQTERLIMRAWREDDLEPFAALNADPEVVEFLPARRSRAESDAMVERIQSQLDEHGYGLWALEVRETGQFVGFTGLALQTFEAPFTPAVEVGWRLTRAAWGYGYATEAGRKAIEYGFAEAGLAEIISMTAVTNLRSRAVMERLGMTRDPADDFGHPRLDPDHPLHPHVLYRLAASSWRR